MSNDNDISRELATPREIAQFMRTTTQSLAQDRYMRRGLPYVKLGRRVFYRWADINAHIAEHVVDPGAVSA